MIYDLPIKVVSFLLCGLIVALGIVTCLGMVIAGIPRKLGSDR